MNATSTPLSIPLVTETLERPSLSTPIVTTLYDLIAAIQDVVDAEDSALVVATLRSILNSGITSWHANAALTIN